MPHESTRPKQRTTRDRNLIPLSRRAGSAPGGVAPASAPASQPGPDHWRYLAALTQLTDSDEDFTTRALADRLGMSTEALLRFQYERPEVMKWASDRLKADAVALAGPLLRRVAVLAQAGSVEHADLLLRVASRAWSVVAVPGTGGQAGPVVVNVVAGDSQPRA